MSLSSFAMRKSWTDINANNKKFNLYMRPEVGSQLPSYRTQKIECEMPYVESGKGFDIFYNAIGSALSLAFQQNDRWKLKYPTFNDFQSTA